jgi:hypothetical protein
MTDDLKPYDPRPEWMQQYHNKVVGGADQFKQWATSTLNIDIDEQLQYDQGTGKAGVAALVLEAVTNQIPFILHNGQQRFCVVIPKVQIIATYTRNGNTTEILDAKQFQNRVKMLYVIYPQFSPASLKLVQSACELAIEKWKDDPPKQPHR